MKGRQLAEWVFSMLKQLEKKTSREKVIEIMEIDGRKSCTSGFKNTIRKLKSKSETTKDFIEHLQEHYKKSSFFEYVNEKELISGHSKCYMMIKSASKPVETDLFCYFCLGHGKEFYETAFNKSVIGEIVDTVMKGGNNCKFRYRI
ncbi:MAG: hypothetical protein GF317_18765 [Candidatus Lokiarchaeota archaeon]|nr:hypothetical protein [Candidatus Lokiarchaeota archaeon]MBD3201560.1 hypothetical protein [Candidatus Lokiarchaeota archaeon]